MQPQISMLSPNKILLVDDDQDDRLLFIEAFNESKTTLQIVQLENGMKLFEYLENESAPRFIIMDFHMELLTGEEILTRMKKSKQYAKIPVIVYSGSSSSIQQHPVLEWGANAYVQKPNSYKETIEIVHSILQLFG